MRKNIWMLNHYAGNMFFNKGGRHYYFAKYLKQLGYNPTVFCSNSKHGPAESFYEFDALWQVCCADEIEVPFVFVKARTYVGNGKQRIFNMLDFYHNVQKAAKEYEERNGKPDIIYASSVHPLTLLAGLKLAKKYGVKCICEVRDLWPESLIAYGMLSKESFVAKVLYMGEKYIYEKADNVIMTWAGGYDYVVERGWDKKIPKSKVTHIDNGFDGDSFYTNILNDEIEDEDLVCANCMKFVYTGSIRKVNNLGVLVDAAEILEKRGVKNIHILVYGDGDEKNDLERRVIEKNLNNIKFKGIVPKTLIPCILKQADVLILHNSSTNLDKYGQSQNKFFEYLAAGKPILMTYSVGHSICKKYVCGVELEKQTPEHIADGIETFTRFNRAEYEEFCKNAFEISMNYDYKKLTAKLVEVIEQI